MLLSDWLRGYSFPFGFSPTHKLGVRFKESAVGYHEQSPDFVWYLLLHDFLPLLSALMQRWFMVLYNTA